MSESRVLLDDLIIGESPRWHDGRLWFCNWGAGELIAVDAGGKSEVIALDPAVDPHSIEWLPDGRLLIVPKSADPATRLLRQEPDGTVVPHADLSGLPSGFNEIVVDGRGNIYVNGADFDFHPRPRGRRGPGPGRPGPLALRPDARRRHPVYPGCPLEPAGPVRRPAHRPGPGHPGPCRGRRLAVTSYSGGP
jgi:sugar lactone lactonase YvrE